MREGYAVTWVNNTGQQNPSQIVYYDINESVVDSMISAIPDGELEALVGRGIIPGSSVTSADEVGEEIEPSLYTIETPDDGTDPVTDTDYDTDVDPGDQDDTMSVPGFPDLPALDTSIEAPEKKDIEELIQNWLSNAPFMSIITGFEVTAGSGQSEFTIPLPEVLGGSATIDFGEFSTLWQSISIIIIAISYIYGAMIIFGGKA